MTGWPVLQQESGYLGVLDLRLSTSGFRPEYSWTIAPLGATGRLLDDSLGKVRNKVTLDLPVAFMAYVVFRGCIGCGASVTQNKC